MSSSAFYSSPLDLEAHVGSLHPLADMGVLREPLPDGVMARCNGELVARARQMTEDAGRRPATVAEAREMLGVVW